LFQTEVVEKIETDFITQEPLDWFWSNFIYGHLFCLFYAVHKERVKSLHPQIENSEAITANTPELLGCA
jgi:hypothetical protein